MPNLPQNASWGSNSLQSYIYVSIPQTNGISPWAAFSSPFLSNFPNNSSLLLDHPCWILLMDRLWNSTPLITETAPCQSSQWLTFGLWCRFYLCPVSPGSECSFWHCWSSNSLQVYREQWWDFWHGTLMVSIIFIWQIAVSPLWWSFIGGLHCKLRLFQKALSFFSLYVLFLGSSFVTLESTFTVMQVIPSYSVPWSLENDQMF